jgi:hypothetical protein
MNNIASFARQAQTHLQTIAGADRANVKRSHVYELLAAALGLGSHAALKAHGLLCPLPSQPLLAHYGNLHPGPCAARAEALGMPRERCGPLAKLMESWHADDPLKVWTWFHYAKLLGKDLTQGDYRAIHEDGSSYDDDVGGPMFVDGVDGIELPTADESVRQEALRAAQSLFARMKAD